MLLPNGGLPKTTEDALRTEVEQAMAELRRANRERGRLLKISEDAEKTADGAYAVTHAMRVQRDAVQKLRRALEQFEAFISGRP